MLYMKGTKGKGWKKWNGKTKVHEIDLRKKKNICDEIRI